MSLASLLHFALALVSASAPLDGSSQGAERRIVEVVRTPPRYGGIPVYLQGVATTTSAPFVIATDEDPSILAPPESKVRRFGFASESVVAARAKQLVMEFALSEDEDDSVALHRVLARHQARLPVSAVARTD